MGLNVIIACHTHRLHSYSMRGEEPLDLQWWMRHHGRCFEDRRIDIYRDCDEYPRDYEHAWEHEERPKARLKAESQRLVDEMWRVSGA